MTTTTRQFQLDRIVTIGARPETVFSFFTDSARWAAWWGAGSSIEAHPGGQVRIVAANRDTTIPPHVPDSVSSSSQLQGRLRWTNYNDSKKN